MVPAQDQLQEFISDPERWRIYEREELAFEASELISKLMEAEGVNKTELADRLGTSKSHITNLLSGARNMTVHTLADLAFVLGHKIELRDAPLAAAKSWLTFENACHGEFIPKAGVRTRDAYKPDRSSLKHYMSAVEKLQYDWLMTA